MSPLLKSIYDACPVSLQNWMLSGFSAQLHRQRYGGRFAEYQALLEESQWWDQARMISWQEGKLRELLCHANEHVPYYQETFKRHGFRPESLAGLEDLQRIPVLTRETVKRRAADLRSRAPELRRLSEGHTSGTTGSPLTLFYDANMMAMNYAALDRQYRWAGVSLDRNGDRIAVLRGNIIVPLKQKSPPYWRHNYFHNHLLLSNFHLSPDSAGQYVSALREFGAVVLDGYPSSLYVLAKLILARKQRLPLKAVLTSSETLFDFQREAIERAFECRVFDYFGAAERVIFTTECDKHQGHHLCEEYGVTEILDDDGKAVPSGQEGYLVGTTLHNYGFPLIRYQSSDRSALKTGTCDCGRGLPLVQDVTTKAEDVVRLGDGRLISPSVLTHPFKPLDSIEGSQLVQTDLDRLIVRIVPGDAFGDGDREHLIRELKARLGQDMRIEIELVAELPRTSRGKFKWVINQVGTGL